MAHSIVTGSGYDALFEQLERDRVWGVIAFRLKDGKPIQIKMETSYRSVQDAIKRRSYEPNDEMVE